MKEVNVNLSNIQEIVVSSKTKDSGWVSKISFEGQFTVGDVARILNLSKQGCPIEVSFSSPQAKMDLEVNEINVSTGEVK
jgi:hypothetical protein